MPPVRGAIMQNEPKLGGTGGRRQRRPSYLGHLPGEWNAQNEANFHRWTNLAAEEFRLYGGGMW